MKAFFKINIFSIIILLTFTFFSTNECFAFQFNQKSYPEIIETLSSDSLFGRSIYNNGKNKALFFLKSYLIKNSTKEIKFQEFSFDTTFNQISKVALQINNNPSKLEKQFLPSGSSPSCDLKNIIHAFTNNNLNKKKLSELRGIKLNGEFAIIKKDDTLEDEYSFSLNEKISILSYLGAKAIFVESDALMFSTSTIQNGLPIVWILPNLIADKDSIVLKISSSIEQYTVTNLLVTPIQISIKPALTLMAHYDHLGTINNSLIYNGANDNASGVASAINLFLMSLSRTNQTQLILTDAEELGLIGSKVLQESGEFHPISFLINLDMMGSQTKGLATVGFTENDSTKEKLMFIAESLSIPIKFRANSPNSDHFFFLENRTKGFYIYSNEGTQPYHNSSDDFSTIDYSFLIKSELILNEFLVYLGF